MAILIISNQKGKYHDAHAKQDVIKYILNPYKTNLWGGTAVTIDDTADSMARVSAHFGKSDGVQLRHYILSFSKEELSSADTANEIAKAIMDYFGKSYQTVYAVHEDTDNLNIHLVINTVSYIDGHRHRGTYSEHHRECHHMKGVLKKHGIFTLKYQSQTQKQTPEHASCLV